MNAVQGVHCSGTHIALDYGQWFAIGTTLTIVNVLNLSNFLQSLDQYMLLRTHILDKALATIWVRFQFNRNRMRCQNVCNGTFANTYHLHTLNTFVISVSALGPWSRSVLQCCILRVQPKFGSRQSRCQSQPT